MRWTRFILPPTNKFLLSDCQINFNPFVRQMLDRRMHEIALQQSNWQLTLFTERYRIGLKTAQSNTHTHTHSPLFYLQNTVPFCVFVESKSIIQSKLSI